MKRSKSLIGNPFIKRQNTGWEVDAPVSLSRSISPPTSKRARHNLLSTSNHVRSQDSISSHVLPSAVIEAGEVSIRDHLGYFSDTLSKFALHPWPKNTPRIGIERFRELYLSNQNDAGRHFVVHQHDHPIAGVHYDLRLQISKTSSISFAIMYGLPGRADSKRLNRNATETRVHNVWNHLIETASNATGSLLIWDTGEYEILPRSSKHDPQEDPDSQRSPFPSPQNNLSHDYLTPQTEPEKLFEAFQNRKIKLRLHGTRLPKNYTLNLRLTKTENRTAQPKKPTRKRRRMGPASAAEGPDETPPSSDAEPDVTAGASDDELVPSQTAKVKEGTTALEKELQEQEDKEVRRTNAYPGAENSIGSIHQRKWYLSLDRTASGFEKVSKQPVRWARKEDSGEIGGFESFFVRGRDVEKSVVTGRNADEIMRDEGVVGYVGRKGWRAVLE